MYWRKNLHKVFSIDLARKPSLGCDPDEVFYQDSTLEPARITPNGDHDHLPYGGTCVAQAMLRAFYAGYTDLRLVGADFYGSRYFDGREVYPERDGQSWGQIYRMQGLVDRLKDLGCTVTSETDTALRL